MHRARIVLTAAVMAEAMNGRVMAGDPSVEPTGFTIDSRVAAPGQAFFALTAARDGPAFAGDAVARGAQVLVVSREIETPTAPPVTVVRVADTTAGLQALGRAVRQLSGAKVVAITGSAGKTTTKEATASLLESRYTVVKNQGNLNNHLGLPLSLLELRHGADIAVMELGMNHAGEISLLVDLATPDVRVWTNVGDAHIGHFGSAEAIAQAKAEILERGSADTVLVANADDSLVMRHVPAFGGRVITFGFSERADVRAIGVEEQGLRGSTSTLVTPVGRTALTVPLLGLGNLANVLCAAAVAVDQGVSLDDIASRAASLRPAKRRGEVKRLAEDITIVDDSYNSSPTALGRALQTLSHEPASRRVAVLGEMLELGDLSLTLHQSSGRVAAASGLGLLVTVGGASARALAGAAVDAGMDAASVRHSATAEEAAALVAALVAPGDVVLVKGSRGVKTDLVVDRLVAERS